MSKSSRVLVLIPGMGSIATTLIAGVEAVKAGLGQPIGSLTQFDCFNGKKLADYFALADLNDLVFSGWDIFSDNVYQASLKAGVLDKDLLQKLQQPLSAIKPMPAVFDGNFIANLEPEQQKSGNKKTQIEALREDIRQQLWQHQCQRAVMLWCGSTESFRQISQVHHSLQAFEQGIEQNDAAISPTQMYAYAALMEGVPFANSSPNMVVDIPALQELAQKQQVPIAGSDLKTGQTLMKTIVASGLAKRHLGIHGWFSTNFLGNRDGLVLDDKDSFKTKEVSKKGVLDTIFDAQKNPQLWGDVEHLVNIHYYKARGDDKESWDNIDLFGWLGYPMQIKINFLCRDSILAAPLLLDLILLLDLAKHNAQSGIQSWLSFYFKSPAMPLGELPVHALDEQYQFLHKKLADLQPIN